MGKKVFKDSSLEKCLEKACKELGIEEEKLIYTVVEDIKGLFKRSVSIEVEDVSEEAIETTDGNTKSELSIINGTIKIEDGNIVVKDPQEGGQPASILPAKDMKLIVDEIHCISKKEVYEQSKIEVEFDESTPTRDLLIETSKDNMEAYISIKYMARNVYALKDLEESNCAAIEKVVKDQLYPPIYGKDEVKQELAKLGITYGIISENLEKCTNKEGINKLLIAKGKPVIDDTDDVIEMKASVNKGIQNFIEDKEGRIDFKSIGFVSSVSEGDIVAVKHNGKPGEDGIDIYGKAINHKRGKEIKIKAGEGCKIDKDGTIISTTRGKPCVKGNVFYVFNVHEITGDVDLSTGNIKFVGDVVVYGNVKEGMKLEAGNSIEVNKSIEKSNIIAKGNIVIKENAILSDIIAGGEDVSKLKLIENLEKMENQLLALSETAGQIKQHNLLGDNASDGQIIKVLIENKFKLIPRIYLGILQDVDIERSSEEKDLVYLIKDKLIGLSPISIKNYGEIDDIILLIKNNINILKASLAIPVNINIGYCQDCNIKSSGDIIFNGKGDYVSNLVANNNIYFMQPGSIARGGVIKAKNTIKCKAVGSSGGVITKLIVEKEGHIWAETAYQNTLFIVGDRQYSLDVASKDIHAYLNEVGEVVVDKFVL